MLGNEESNIGGMIFQISWIKNGGEKVVMLFCSQVVASGAATTPVEVEAYASCTMLAASLRKEEDENRSSQVTDDSTRRCIQFLEENEFIR